METKSELLRLLKAAEGSAVSGEALALQLGISRAAVWKAVEALKKQGFSIEAVPGVGYTLARKNDVFSREEVLTWLENPATQVQVWQQVSSTNLLAKQWALEGAPHGSMVLAQEQTGGRGRLGRSFASPPGGLYMSVVLRPQKEENNNAVLVTAAAAVVVCKTIRQLCGLQLQIKWVNDLFYASKKCCGILCEAGTGFEANSIEYIVVGIGINYCVPPLAFPPELRDIATSLFAPGQAPVPRAQLAASIHKNLLASFGNLGEKDFLEEYRRRSLVVGRTVTVLAQPPYVATAIAIDEQAHLIVQKQDGERVTLEAGEIGVKI